MSIEQPNEYKIVVDVASLLTGKEYTTSIIDAVEAYNTLNLLHKAVFPDVPRHPDLFKMVKSGDQRLVLSTLEEAELALSRGDYAKALAKANHLFAYGEVDYMDGVASGKVFRQALEFHRKFATEIQTQLKEDMIYTPGSNNSIYLEIEQARKFQDGVREMELTRYALHVSAMKGILGRQAVNHVDPFAIVSFK